jgi:hypothetical protein
MAICAEGTRCDTFCYSILSIITIGTICLFLSLSVYFVWTLELTAYDTSVLVWLFVALGIAVSVLFIAFYLNCCNWRFSRILLGILYAIFDLFLLLAGIAVFSFRTEVLDRLGDIWSDDVDSSIERYFERRLKCCGFKTTPKGRECAADSRLCFDVLEEELARYSGWIGGILMGLFALLLVGVGIAFYRSCAKPPVSEDYLKAQELAQIQSQLNDGGNIWF